MYHVINRRRREQLDQIFRETEGNLRAFPDARIRREHMRRPRWRFAAGETRWSLSILVVLSLLILLLKSQQDWATVRPGPIAILIRIVFLVFEIRLRLRYLDNTNFVSNLAIAAVQMLVWEFCLSRASMQLIQFLVSYVWLPCEIRHVYKLGKV